MIQKLFQSLFGLPGHADASFDYDTYLKGTHRLVCRDASLHIKSIERVSAQGHITYKARVRTRGYLYETVEYHKTGRLYGCLIRSKYDLFLQLKK